MSTAAAAGGRSASVPSHGDREGGRAGAIGRTSGDLLVPSRARGRSPAWCPRHSAARRYGALQRGLRRAYSAPWTPPDLQAVGAEVALVRAQLAAVEPRAHALGARPARRASAAGRCTATCSRCCARAASSSASTCCFEPGVWLTAAAPGRIRIGEGSFLNLGVQVAAVDLVEIGAHCMFANGCFVTDANHRFDDPDRPVPWQGFTTQGPDAHRRQRVVRRQRRRHQRRDDRRALRDRRQPRGHRATCRRARSPPARPRGCCSRVGRERRAPSSARSMTVTPNDHDAANTTKATAVSAP